MRSADVACLVVLALGTLIGSAAAAEPQYGKVETFQPGKKYTCLPTADHKGWDCSEAGKDRAAPRRETPPQAAGMPPASTAPAPPRANVVAPPERAPQRASPLPSYLRALSAPQADASPISATDVPAAAEPPATSARPASKPMPTGTEPAESAAIAPSPANSSAPPQAPAEPAAQPDAPAAPESTAVPAAAAPPASTAAAEASPATAADHAGATAGAPSEAHREPAAPVAAPTPTPAAAAAPSTPAAPAVDPRPVPLPAATAPAIEPEPAQAQNVPVAPPSTPTAVAGRHEFLALPASSYVVELAHGEDRALLDATRAAVHPPNGTLYELHLQRDSADWWVLLWGTFDSIDSARSARGELPAQALTNAGWPRRVAPLQAEVQRSGE